MVRAPLPLKQLAKDGNPQAITQMLNRILQPKGITAKALLHNGVLKIALQSRHLLVKSQLVTGLERSFQTLSPKSIHAVSVFGLQWGSARPLWSHTFRLHSEALPDLNTLDDPSQLSDVEDTQLRLFLADLDDVTLLDTGRALGLGPSLEWPERNRLEGLILIKIHQLLTLATTELSEQPEIRLSHILLASRIVYLSQLNQADLISELAQDSAS